MCHAKLASFFGFLIAERPDPARAALRFGISKRAKKIGSGPGAEKAYDRRIVGDLGIFYKIV